MTYFRKPSPDRIARRSDLSGERGFIGALLRDTGANTLALTAAAVIPLIGVVGGGVDTGRMYLAKSRLQQACDSATLAARKQLGGTELGETGIPAELHDTADNFFETNFAAGSYGTTDTDYELSHEEGTRLDGEASTKVPTTLMAVFGYDDVDIAVECSADLNLPNIDIALVLDMSGSMSSTTDGVRRIDALKEAVFAFYDEIMAVAPANARVRIGIVPYNSNINVGQMLMAENPQFIADEWKYQSREANFENVMVDPGSPGGEQLYSDARETVPREKAWFGSTYWFDYSWSSDKNHPQYGEDGCNAMDGTYTVGGERWVVSDDDYYKNYFPDRHPSATGGCVARVRKYRTIAPTPARYELQFTGYTYKERTFDTSVFKTGVNTRTNTGNAGGNVTSKWNNCIEERKTVAGTDFNPVPEGALDLDIDLVPTAGDLDTQWYPIWPQITFDRGRKAERIRRKDQSQYRIREATCPVRTHKLTAYPLSGGGRDPLFQARIDALEPNGGTLHDVGMIWGGRIISPDGIFAGENTTAPNGEPITRHLIFMTDGQMGGNPYYHDHLRQLRYG